MISGVTYLKGDREGASVFEQQDVEVDPPQREPVELRPGVSDKLTYRAFVPLANAVPIRIRRATGGRTVAAREFIYALLGVLQHVRWAFFGPPDTRGALRGRRARRLYRGVRSKLARQLVPRTEVAEFSVASTAACIEISRHVILLGQLARKRQQLRDRRLICHVYATGPGLARERLLERFIDRVLNADPANTPIADPESGAVLTLQYQRNFARRRYFELVIGLVQSPDLEVIHADFLATTPVPVSRHATVAPVGEARSEADWSLVHSAIERARLARRPLDDAFVEELARKRLKYARASYLYPEAQDAGPTPDSSRRIVREIVKLHELADTFPARGNEDRLDGRGS